MERDKIIPGGFWHRHGSYDIGRQPDSYLVSHGRAFLLRHVPRSPRLADFGCWGGRHLDILSQIAGSEGETIGIDGPWAWERLGEAVAVARKLGSNVKVIQQDLDDLHDLATESVHGGICWRVLHNLTRPGELDAALWEINRVLVPGSPLVVAVRAAISEIHDMDFDFPQLTRTTPSPIAPVRCDLYFTRRSAEVSFKRSGFKIVEVLEVLEGESIDGQEIENRYLAIHMLRL